MIGSTLTYSYRTSRDGGFVGYINELPNVLSQGESKSDLEENLRDALNAMFAFNIETSKVVEGEYDSAELVCV
jgi:predicted RNase H-like HicB family nuclease